jgi:hypothetical protein
MALLITELMEDFQYLKEETEKGEKNYFIEGIIMQADIKNRNGRMYPSEILKNEVGRYNKTYVEQHRAFGELGHPSGPTINLDRVSHLFTELKEDGSNIVGKAKVLDTPMGKIVKNIIDEGGRLGISSRGMGSLKEGKSGIMEVQKDFTLATAGDIVADPSGPNCFVNGIMENASFVFDIMNNKWVNQSDICERVVKEVKEVGNRSKKELEEKASKLFEKFLKSL